MKPSRLSPIGTGSPHAETTVGEPEYGPFDIDRTFVQLDRHVPGVVYEPVDETDRSSIVFVVMHCYEDYTTHFARHLAQYGYRVLAADALASRMGTEQGQFHLHDSLVDLSRAVSHATDLTGVETVLNCSHSAGPQLLALYQNVAENGLNIARGPEKLYPLPAYLQELELRPADGLVLLDPHLGDAPKGLIDLGPQVVDPTRPQRRQQTVDMLDPTNGYNPEPGKASSYSKDFLKRFFRGQADRMQSLITDAQRRLDAIETDNGRFPDDDEFLLIDARSRVFRPDPTILAHTESEHELLRYADSEKAVRHVTEERIKSVRDVREPDYTPPITFTGDEVEQQSIRRFLSTRAIRPIDGYRLTASTIEGIEWNSANAQVPGNLQTVSAPLYVLGMTGHYFVVQSEVIWEQAGSSDKTLQYVEGATHGGNPLDPSYGDTRHVILDAINRWTTERFV